MMERLIDILMSGKKVNLAKFVKHDIALEARVAKKTATIYEGVDPDHDKDSEETAIKKLEEDFPRRDDEELNTQPDRDGEEELHAPRKDGEEGDEDENALDNDKEYFGKKEDDFFYLVTSSDEGESDLRIIDSEEKVLYSANENNLDPGDVFHFIIQAVTEVEPDLVSTDIFTRYIKPKIEELEREDEEDYGTEEVGRTAPEPENNKFPRESKEHLRELKIVFDDHNFNVSLSDDGTLDTVIEINGREFRVGQEVGEMYRDKSGAMTEDGLRELAEYVLSSLEKEEFEELSPTKNAESIKLPFDLDKIKEVNVVTQGIRQLKKGAKTAFKDGDFTTAAELTGQLAAIHSALPEIEPELKSEEANEDANEDVDESIVDEVNIVTQGIKQLTRATKDAIKQGDFTAAAEFSANLATIHNALPEIEVEEETKEGKEKEGDFGGKQAPPFKKKGEKDDDDKNKEIAIEGVDPDHDKDSEETAIKKLEEDSK